jgi:hypothetical protein
MVRHLLTRTPHAHVISGGQTGSTVIAEPMRLSGRCSGDRSGVHAAGAPARHQRSARSATTGAPSGRTIHRAEWLARRAGA